MMHMLAPTTIVTGGSSGIGLAIVRRVLQRRGRVDAVGSKPINAALLELKRVHPGLLQHHRADLGDADETEALCITLARNQVVAFVHCAGEASPSSLKEPLPARAVLGRLTDLHVGAALHMSAALAPAMTTDARVVLISSNLTRRVAPGMAAYAAAKGAVETLTRYLAVELAPIVVACVAPGIVDTRMASDLVKDTLLVNSIRAHTPLGRIATPDDIAAIVDVLLTVSPCWSTGAVIEADGGNGLRWPNVDRS